VVADYGLFLFLIKPTNSCKQVTEVAVVVKVVVPVVAKVVVKLVVVLQVPLQEHLHLELDPATAAEVFMEVVLPQHTEQADSRPRALVLEAYIPSHL
jgi:hypothetical protein